MTDSERDVPGSENAAGNQPRPEGDPLAPKPEKPGEEKAEAKQPVLEYGIVQSTRAEPQSNFMAGQFPSAGVDAQGRGQNAGGATPFLRSRLSEKLNGKTQESASNQTKFYAAAGVGIGLLVGLAAALMFLHSAASSRANDMGPVIAGEYGLKGHLVTNWREKKEKLEYQLTVEPGDPAQRAAFSFDVNASPRPLSVDVQLKDPYGAVLCGDTILLKFDPRNALAGAGNDTGPKAGKAEKDIAARNEIAQGITLAQQESHELDREQGKDIFQNQVGADGQIASISAQGTMACTRKQFDRIASWSFTSSFPVVSNAAGNRNFLPEPEAAKPSAAGKTKRKPVPAVPPIYVEGDDTIVWFDALTGEVQTSAGKVLFVDKTDAVATTLKGGDFPISIHYRCDQTGACMFSGVGKGVEHARSRR